MSMMTGPSFACAFLGEGPAFTDDGVFGCGAGFAPDSVGSDDDGFGGRGAFDAVDPGSRFTRAFFEAGREDFGDDAERFFGGICGGPSPAAATLSTGFYGMVRAAAAMAPARVWRAATTAACRRRAVSPASDDTS
jgi:hypothetical protein